MPDQHAKTRSIVDSRLWPVMSYSIRTIIKGIHTTILEMKRSLSMFSTDSSSRSKKGSGGQQCHQNIWTKLFNEIHTMYIVHVYLENIIKSWISLTASFQYKTGTWNRHTLSHSYTVGLPYPSHMRWGLSVTHACTCTCTYTECGLMRKELLWTISVFIFIIVEILAAKYLSFDVASYYS